MAVGIWFVSYFRYLLSRLKGQQKSFFELEIKELSHTERVVAKIMNALDHPSTSVQLMSYLLNGPVVSKHKKGKAGSTLPVLADEDAVWAGWH